MQPSSFTHFSSTYLTTLNGTFTPKVISQIEQLADAVLDVWLNGRHLFVCGNGGSAANAVHLSNDLFFGLGRCHIQPPIPGLRVTALPANSAILTCLGNDLSYDEIFASQLTNLASPNDLLLVLSGSGS